MESLSLQIDGPITGRAYIWWGWGWGGGGGGGGVGAYNRNIFFPFTG